MASAIIFNQRFEISWLEDIERRLGEEPREVMQIGDRRLMLVPQGVIGMEHRPRFQPAPVRSIETTIEGSKAISEFDVMFAKDMKMRHEMALEMAHDYNQDPFGDNRVIREINLGILASQAVEIGLLEDVMAACGGDADAIESAGNP